MPGGHQRGLFWSDPRVKPPYGSVEVDWGHPLARGVEFVTLLNEGAGGPLELTQRRIGALLGATPPLWGATGKGIGLIGQTNTAENGIDYGNLPYLANIAAATASWAFLINPKDATECNLAERGDLTFDAEGWQIGDLSAAGWLALRVSNSASSNTRAAINTPPLGKSSSVVFVFDGTQTGSNIKIYLDGVAQSHAFDSNGDGSGFGDDTTGPRHKVRLMFQDSANAKSFTGQMAYAYIWKGRQLQASDALRLHAEPYAFLRPIIRRRYSVPAAGGITGALDQNLAAFILSAAGALALAGAATPTLDTLTAAATGAQLVAGAAAITFDGLTATATGALPVAGVAAVTFAGLTPTAAGTLPIAGVAAITFAALTMLQIKPKPVIERWRWVHTR